MNPLFDPIGFDPLEQIERSGELVPADSAMPVDLLDVMSARLEESIEQPPVPELDAFADPLASTLDRVEASVEGPRCGMPQFGSDPLLDQIEMETERQVIPPESGAADADLSPCATESRWPAPGPGGSFPSGPGTFTPTGRGGREYVHRPSGSGSGIRSQPAMVYCSLSREWVDAGGCPECSDFEPPADPAGDDEERCRHAWASGD